VALFVPVLYAVLVTSDSFVLWATGSTAILARGLTVAPKTVYIHRGADIDEATACRTWSGITGIVPFS